MAEKWWDEEAERLNKMAELAAKAGLVTINAETPELNEDGSEVQNKTLKELFSKLKGGPGSGNHDHRGVPGQHGGSAPKGTRGVIIGGEVAEGRPASKTRAAKPLAKRSQAEAKEFATKRLADLGYKAKFEKTKDGKLRVIDASNPRKPKPTKWHILEDGRVVRINKGQIDSEMTDEGVKLTRS